MIPLSDYVKGDYREWHIYSALSYSAFQCTSLERNSTYMLKEEFNINSALDLVFQNLLTTCSEDSYIHKF